MPKNIRSLVFATDIHLEFCSQEWETLAFARTLQNAPGDAVLLTRDITNALGLTKDLAILEKDLGRLTYVLGGNHDMYLGSFHSTEECFATVTKVFPHVHRLTGREIIPLTERTALIGVDGWCDGRGQLGIRTNETSTTTRKFWILRSENRNRPGSGSYWRRRKNT
jgi:hypothetical protein